MNNIYKILQKAKNRTELSREELVALLRTNGDAEKQLYEIARLQRDKRLGKKVKAIGMVEFSNYCRSSCKYCSMRRDNKDLTRYRMNEEEIIDTINKIVKRNYKSILFQSGEDRRNLEILLNALPRIKQKDLEIILCCGEFGRKSYTRLKKAGTDVYMVKFETSDRELHNLLRPHSKFEKRLNKIHLVRELGHKLGTGNIVGLPGQTIEMLVEDLLLLRSLNPYMISNSPFIPNRGSPFQDYISKGTGRMTLKIIAIERLLMDSLIFANTALATEGTGQLAALKAGANVITVNFTPIKYRPHFTLYSPDRRIKEEKYLLSIIKQAGLKSY